LPSFPITLEGQAEGKPEEGTRVPEGVPRGVTEEASAEKTKYLPVSLS